MFRKSLFIFGSLLGAAVASAAPTASGPVSLTSELKLDRVVTEAGVKKHVLVTPSKVVPGDMLIFTTSYRNSGAKTITNFVVTNPIPKGTVLASDGFGNFTASVDGGKSWGQLASLTVADGKGGRRAAQATDVTQVRWVITSIAPGSSGSVEYHAIVR